MTRNGIGKWGPGFLSALLLVSLCRSGIGQQGATAMQLEHGDALKALAARLTLECAADSAAIFVGQTGVIRAHGVSLTGSPLTYSFGTSAGQLAANGAVAELRTVGLSPQVVRVTCAVKDNAGNSASKIVQVTLRKLIAIQDGKADIVAPHPVIPPQEKTEAAKIPPLPKPAPPVALPIPAPVQHYHPGIGNGGAPAPAPTPAPPPAPAPVAGDQGPPPAVNGYQQGTTFAEWVKTLKTGKIEYLIPMQMLMQQPSPATVVIHSFSDTATNTLPNAGSGSLLQSDNMKVELLAENPGDFTIVPQSSAVQFIPPNKSTTWTWSVTPNTSGKDKLLMVRASVIYPGDEKMAEQLQPYTAVVAVNVPSLWQRIVTSYQDDPLKWFSYVVPGGGGFAFLVGIFVWWRKKKGKE